MTAPNQSRPDGSLGTGDFAAWQAMTEADAKNKMKIPLGAWNTAQDNAQNGFAGTPFVQHEVDRLDNRIDEIVGDEGVVQIATMSTSGWWIKPPGASRVVVNKMAGSSGGGRSNRPGDGSYPRGVGGFSGGWVVEEYDAEDLPSAVWVTIGPGGAGGTSIDTSGAPGGDTTFGSYGLTATGAGPNSYGSGNKTFRMRGGDGAHSQSDGLASNGSSGSFSRGGYGATGYGQQGENGFSLTASQIAAGQVGMGSAGGGGGPSSAGTAWSAGGRGGQGGWPSGPGGGGGGSRNNVLGSNPASGNGGNAGSGACIITTYTSDAKLSGPTTPTNLTASDITETSATLTWTASTDDVSVEEYEVTVNGAIHGFTPTITYDLTGLFEATAYQVIVTAIDGNGNRTASDVFALMTTGDTPPTPEIVGVAASGYDGVATQNNYDVVIPTHQPLDMLVLIVATWDNTSVTVPNGWTSRVVAMGANATDRIYVMTKIAGESEPATQVVSSASAQKWQAAVIAVRYVTAVDVTGFAVNAASGTQVAPSVTTTAADTLLLRVVSTSGNDYRAKTWSGATELTDRGFGTPSVAGVSMTTAWSLKATAGATGTASASGTSDDYAAVTVALKR